VYLVSLAVILALPSYGWAKDKSHHKAERGLASLRDLHSDAELTRIYQSVIRDSHKQLMPTVSEHSVYLPTEKPQLVSRDPASKPSLLSARAESRYQLANGTHSAMPWAAEGSVGGALFSLK
jgi:hypothetical protein